MMATNDFGAKTAGRAAPSRYRRARVASWALFGLAAALAAVFVVHIARFESAAPTRPESETAAPASTEVVATDSRLTGFDRERQPFSVTAERAVQDAAEPNLVRLTGVAGELNRASGDTLGLAARRALFDSKTDVLQLEGDVTLVSDGRFVAEMAKADVTLTDKRLRSQGPVLVTFERGLITAGGLEITEDGNRVVFFDRAKVTLGPPAKDDRLP